MTTKAATVRRDIHLYAAPIVHESRVLRVTSILAETGLFDDICIIGTHTANLRRTESLDEVRHVLRIPRPFERPHGVAQRILNTYLWGRRVERAAARMPAVCINCHSLSLLPLAVRLKRKYRAALVYEPHELETESIMSRGYRRLAFKRIERRLIGEADLVVVVGHAIADWYRREYDLPDVHVFRNIPPSAPDRLNRSALRARFTIPERSTLYLYLGGLFPKRRIEQYLRVFRGLGGDHHVVFMGSGPLDHLVQAAASEATNIHFMPAVLPDDVVAYAAGADMGLCGVEAECLSYRLCLPNKLFEYLHAGLGVISTDLPEVAAVVRRHGCGVILPDGSDESLAVAIRSLQAPLVAEFRRGAESAQESNAFGDEAERLKAVYRGLFALAPTGQVAAMPAH
jgi:glycosyltransferase involved in cell wall biosynthesis